MGWKSSLGFLFFVFVVLSLMFYWVIPRDAVLYGVKDLGNSNFSLGFDNGVKQFYDNLRYSGKVISYSVDNCPLSRQDEVENAVLYIENLTILKFNEVSSDAEIKISCEDSVKIEGGSFIAGEGGVTNVTKTDKFNVIHEGRVLLLRETKCERPIVGTHELLHALGFEHSDNPINIMYPTVNCRQTIGDDLVSFINNLYSVPSLPDLGFEDVSAQIRGKYLDSSFVVRNNGLIEADKSKVIIKSDNKIIKEVDIKSLDVGYGVEISFKNQWIRTLNPDKELVFEIVSEYNELDKRDNLVVLEN